MEAPDLTPFGFTATESRLYSTLLHLGSATGYAVARAARLARANAYGALDGLGPNRASLMAALPGAVGGAIGPPIPLRSWRAWQHSRERRSTD
jgi:hypothetical protein